MHVCRDLLNAFYFCIHTCSEEKLELFYPKVFVEIQENTAGSSVTVPTLFHATHYAEIVQICDGEQAVLKGRNKPWRDTSNPDKGSYLVDYRDNSRQWIFSSNNDSLPGNLVWFGTSRDEGKIYGPCQFEFNYKRVLQAYQVSRGVDQKICYKVGGTLIYQQEVSHVVIVCCEADECYKQFPTIQEDKKTTKFFVLSRSKSNLPRILINEYPRYDSSDIWSKRHEHVILAFHLPSDDAPLKLANEVKYSELKQIPHTYCMKSKGECEYAVNPSLVDNKVAKWDRFRLNQSNQL